jgi:parallel beta-helix repeat protein
MLAVRRALLVIAGLAVVACSGCAAGFTGPPDELGVDHAFVNGNWVDSTSGTVDTWVQYGLTPAYGLETAHAHQILDPGVTQGDTRHLIAGLQRDTVYHYRVCASDPEEPQAAPGCGEDRRLRTQPVTCGDTVTADVRLTGDLGSCSGDYILKIGADGVDINLAGHTLSGFVSPRGDAPPGIVNDGFDDVTVRNGSLSGFTVAFSATGASRNVLRNLDAAGLAVGASFVGGADNEVRHSDLAGATNGAVRSRGSARLVVADSRLGATFSDAGALIESDDARIVRNTFVPVLDFEDRLPALKLTGNRAHIADNVVSGQWHGGFVLSGSDNVVTGNRLSGLFGDGIFVSAFSSRLTLRDNVVDGFPDDGFDVQSASTRLGGNSATNNGDWGIDAVAGVTDLGGNAASGNGQAAQCRNVACD